MPHIIKKNPPLNLNYCLMRLIKPERKVILLCANCPFNNQDCVYCRTCKNREQCQSAHLRKKSPAPLRRWFRRQSEFYRASFGYGWGVWGGN